LDDVEAVATTDLYPTVELALRALLEETSKMVWERQIPVYIPY
jgi:hypothetical protein